MGVYSSHDITFISFFKTGAIKIKNVVICFFTAKV
jgi:hypothetical protein